MHPAARLSVVARTRTRFQFRCGTISPQHVVEEVETPHARSPPWLPTTIPYIVSISRGIFRLLTWHCFSPIVLFSGDRMQPPTGSSTSVLLQPLGRRRVTQLRTDAKRNMMKGSGRGSSSF
ncbi:uncharacterized protein TEOVI_000616100 [Trypanosoma equiperdum]|uniref:Uncharacterized protein n=2 Tax=Trypanozoon TaxID=39700 RepID=Q388C1_TRYB2|nr:hypothetical protein, unlikely [Trypanosoma brucei brucei TREU927]EAN78851.1 hypothetical protein, unlikely [Trypanosoma brucei brucei TREU927]SCU68791.1 hypothetical protein, conserved [Trypanosoma equiperdum]